jgi:hypothetical protein
VRSWTLGADAIHIPSTDVHAGIKRPFLIPVVVAAGAGLFTGLGLSASGGTVTLTARLDARHEIPAPKGAATASGLFTATLTGRSLTWRLTFSRLTGKAAAAHIHLGKAGVAGPVAVPLCAPCASGAHGKVIITTKVRAALVGGSAYVNVHTAKNPGGEIRGQVGSGKRGANPVPAETTTTTDDSGGYGY